MGERLSVVKASPHRQKNGLVPVRKIEMRPKLDTLKDHEKGKGHKIPLTNINIRSQLPFKPVIVTPVRVKKVELKLTAMAVCNTSFNAMDHIGEIVSNEGQG